MTTKSNNNNKEQKNKCKNKNCSQAIKLNQIHIKKNLLEIIKTKPLKTWKYAGRKDIP